MATDDHDFEGGCTLDLIFDTWKSIYNMEGVIQAKRLAAWLFLILTVGFLTNCETITLTAFDPNRLQVPTFLSTNLINMGVLPTAIASLPKSNFVKGE
jgi:hypothetical protein